MVTSCMPPVCPREIRSEHTVSTRLVVAGTCVVRCEHHGLRPIAGRSDSIRDYALVWRIDGDHAAGISWMHELVIRRDP